MNKLVNIPDALYQAIEENTKISGLSKSKEITEMLWLALQPRSEQLKKIKALRERALSNSQEKDSTIDSFDKDIEETKAIAKTMWF